MSTPIQVTTCYRFLPLSPEKVAEIQAALEAFAAANGVRGLCLLGAEGANMTVSAPDLSGFKARLSELFGVDDLVFKDSTHERHPFHVFKVKIKDEIVTLGRPGLAPDRVHNHHLTPQEWKAALADPNTVVIDTRNDYEVDIGKFKSAIDFRMKEFREFPEAVRQAAIPKDRKVLMYCTGGIRCEKAILAMNEQGYGDVHQLEGGILNYLKEFPDDEFEGECFVFDYRVAVDQKLEPSQTYRLCPHCGQPGSKVIHCAQCTSESVICEKCQASGQDTCSKNCAHHRVIGSQSRKPHQQEQDKRRPR